ncbi:hypothetical protein [Sporosarcina sp. FSL K6-1508]|uniref:hypothetical protein n=1 Tax=Sporosarcina sp. FSL K6-1508 TaxID=2921553 RepID=UPI0030F5DA76
MDRIRNSAITAIDALWVPPEISQKGDHLGGIELHPSLLFYRSGYHEVAPSLDGPFEKAHFIFGDETYNLECHKSSEGD